MRLVGLWYGGTSYAVPDPERDLETFRSLADARETLRSREDNDDGRTPVVEGSELHLYRGEYSEHGPDYILTIGPRGGVRTERG